MAKEIKIGIKNADKLEFELEESGQIGDWFSLKNLENSKLNDVRNSMEIQISKWKAELKDEVKKEEKINWENAFRVSPEFQELANSKIELKNKIDNMIKNKDLEIEQELKVYRLKSQQTVTDLKQRIEHTREMQSKEIENAQFKITNALNEKHQLELKNLNQTIEELKRQKIILEEDLERRMTRNIKEMGEEFETWIMERYDESFGGFSNDTKLEKANKIVGGNKPDFIFTVLNDDKSIIEKVVIEAKTQSLTGKTRNQDHYEKLEKDRKNNDAEYSLLISELEPNNGFMIKRVPEYENMFVIRPGYFTSFLALIRHISLKKKTILRSQLDFENKEKILQDFDFMKNEILENSIKNIEKNCETILKKSEVISSAAKDIRDSANIIIEKHLKTVENKINNFKITKIGKEIEKLNQN